MISVVLCSDCFKSTKNCRDSAFSNSGLEVGLPAFQLRMFAKCEALPKGDLWDMLICLKNPFPPNSWYSFFQRHSIHEEIRESVRVNY